jgi:anti-sigma factor RsiW
MNTCERYEEAMSAYCDAELDDAAGAELFSHLGSCPECRRAFASYTALRPRIAAVQLLDVPVRLDRRIARLHSSPAARFSRLRQSARSVWTGRLVVPAPALALGLLLLTASILVSALVIKTTPPPPGEQQVMYIFSMPAIEVQGVPDQTSSHIQ